MNAPIAIQARDLTKSFGEITAVQGLTIEVPAGIIYGFLGPNGSGKTTTLRMLCGLLSPDAGEGTCLGFDLRRETWRIKRVVGYMPQRFGLYEDLTIRENLEFIARIYGLPAPRRAVDDIIGRLGLGGERGRQLTGELSGGWKQRLALAACILHRPRLLLLDEPTAGVDPKARRDFWDEIHGLASDGITILVSTHYMDEAERCHQIGYLSFGRLLLHGDVDEVRRSAGICAWRITGPGIERRLNAVRAVPGIETATIIGDDIRAIGSDARIEDALKELCRDSNLRIEQATPTLEEVFVHTMNQDTAHQA